MENRVIKFRYRYTDGKNWIMQVFTLDEISNGAPYEALSDMPLHKAYKHVGQDEFSALLDKHGKEIFEFDLLLLPDTESESVDVGIGVGNMQVITTY